MIYILYEKTYHQAKDSLTHELGYDMQVRCYSHQNSAWHLVKYYKYNKIKCHVKEVTIFIPSCSWSGTDLEKKR